MAGEGATAQAPRTFRLEPYSYADALALVEGLGISEPVAVTLVRRGYRTVAEARAFLEAADDHDPFEFEAMVEVCERIRAAIAAGRRITVHGDYDVDGVSATAILVRTLRELGADCDWHIPSRLDDGYGLTDETVRALSKRGTGLLITVDCGIVCADEIALAHSLGVEVIVTDHHQPGERLPDCATLHPELSGYPCAELCATGVAHKLAVALRGADVEADLDLVALATVADLVPLRGENRALVRRGLAAVRRARRPGLRALIASAGLKPERLDEGDLAFRLAPRINAAGRLYRADAGVELMLTEDEARAAEIAAELERANRERRTVEREVLAGAEGALRELPDEAREAPGIVLAGAGWHPGVVGIVASRLAERLWRPVVLVALDDAGAGRGSGRSVPGFDLLAALDACSEHLTRYGGHRAAAGVELEAARLEDFRRAFAQAVADRADPDAFVPTETVDAVVGGESLGHSVAEELRRLGPFGLGNPGIRLLVPSARVGDVRPMGEGERHARFSLRSGSRSALGVAFGVNGELEAATREPHDLSVRLELNEWNGSVSPRVVLGEVYRSEPDARGGDETCGAEEFWQRVDAEIATDLDDWPPAALSERIGAGSVRERVDRRGHSGIAAVAALASSGESVLVLAADALRRRELVERAVRPALFGGGEVALLSRRLSEHPGHAALERLHAARAGVALADWAALAARAEIGDRFRHVVVVDPPCFSHLDRLALVGEGYLHVVCREDDHELALRSLAEEWPGREVLAWLYRALRRRAGGRGEVPADDAHTLLAGAENPYPRCAEVAARALRVMVELGLVSWRGSGTERRLVVVSSEATDLERSDAYVAYRRRREEGERYLSEARQSS